MNVDPAVCHVEDLTGPVERLLMASSMTLEMEAESRVPRLCGPSERLWRLPLRIAGTASFVSPMP